MEISNKNERSLINQVEYQVFDEQKNPLDLSICNDSNIKIFYGIKNNTNLDKSIINSFKDSGVDVFNISDEFFNDKIYIKIILYVKKAALMKPLIFLICLFLVNVILKKI